MKTVSLQQKVEDQILDNYEAMYRLAYSYVRNEEDALDIVQESVYKAIKNAGKVQQEAYIRTWIWRIVMNTAVDLIRSRKNETGLEEAGETGKEDTYQDFDTLEALKILEPRGKSSDCTAVFRGSEAGGHRPDAPGKYKHGENHTLSKSEKAQGGIDGRRIAL